MVENFHHQKFWKEFLHIYCPLYQLSLLRLWLLTSTGYNLVLYYTANTLLINAQTNPDWYIDRALPFHRQWNSDIKTPEEVSLVKCRKHFLSSEQPEKWSALLDLIQCFYQWTTKPEFLFRSSQLCAHCKGGRDSLTQHTQADSET